MKAKKTLTVKEWEDEDKPREKMLLRGKKELSTAELVAILLRSGVPGKSVLDVAKEVLRMTDGSLTSLSRLEHSQLATIQGVGETKAITLLAALELGWRMMGEIDAGKETVINNSDDLFRYMVDSLANIDHEEFWAVYLSNRRKVLGRQRISMGGLTETSVDLRLIFRGALESKAVQLAVVHNHPSGNLTPSKADKQLTERIEKAGTLLGIRLIEHLIIALTPTKGASYFSFHDNLLI